MRANKSSKLVILALFITTLVIFSGCIGTTLSINHSPTIVSLTANPQSPIEVNQSTTITCLATDQDGDTLIYSWNKTGGTITGSGSTITWTAPAISETYAITCTVSDGNGGQDSKSINIKVTALIAVSQYVIQWSIAKSNGWANPLGEGEELITSTAYDYNSDIYLDNWGRRHAGIDIHAQDETNVYAIADGTVVHKYSQNSWYDDGILQNLSVIIIKHTNSDNENFFAIYGHVLAKDGLKSTVEVGEKVGVVAESGDPHLHFGINISSEFIYDFLAGECGWGRVPADADPSDYGWVDPIDYLTTYIPLSRLTPEEIELIRKWGYGGDCVVRWPNGYVDVYDETNYSQMQEVLNQWNAAIGGPVILRLSSNPNSPVKVIFDSYSGYCGYEDVQWGADYTFSEVIIKINPSGSCCGDPNIKYCLYLHMFNAVAGFNCWAEVDPCPFETWSNFNTIPDTIKTILRALYRVPPGYCLGESKQRKDHSNVIIKNVFTSGGENCLDEGKE